VYLPFLFQKTDQAREIAVARNNDRLVVFGFKHVSRYAQYQVSIAISFRYAIPICYGLLENQNKTAF